MSVATEGKRESRSKEPISVLRLWLAVMGLLLVLLGVCGYFLRQVGG